MASNTSSRPAFVGASWFQPEQGYSYASAPQVDLRDPRNLHSDNEWLRFLYIWESAKLGDFNGVAALPDLIRETTDPALWGASLQLLAIANRQFTLEALFNFMSDSSYDVRLDAYAASTLSYNLAIVEPLLQARQKRISMERGTIENALSHLLEAQAGPICEPLQITPSKYDDIVRRRASEIDQELGPSVAVYRGNILDVGTLINKIKALAGSSEVQELSGTLMDDLNRFEALTGWPCVGLFDEEGNALPLNIRATIESFERTNPLKGFQAGHRYFFGRIID
jgi:hypothetical protein